MGCVRTACRPHIITHSPKPTSTHSPVRRTATHTLTTCYAARCIPLVSRHTLHQGEWHDKSSLKYCSLSTEILPVEGFTDVRKNLRSCLHSFWLLVTQTPCAILVQSHSNSARDWNQSGSRAEDSSQSDCLICTFKLTRLPSTVSSFFIGLCG